MDRLMFKTASQVWRTVVTLSVSGVFLLLTGCSGAGAFLSRSGPSTKTIDAVRAGQPETIAPGSSSLLVVDLDTAVIRRVENSRKSSAFSQSLPAAKARSRVLAPGDVIEIAVWEAPPAALFGGVSAMSDSRFAGIGARAVVLPETMVESDGMVSIPFAGSIPVLGKTTTDVEADVTQRLKGKANQPQVSVRLTRNASNTVTVVGEVTNSVVVPLTARNERLLDAIATAGGARQPIDKMTVQMTRGASVRTMPLGQVIREPQENIVLQAGDVVTLFSQPLSIMALGATGKNDEIYFESQGISLIQAIARAGGLQDSRADVRGVFIFRFEDPSALGPTTVPLAVTADNKVPVIYRIDLFDPAAFFAAQAFAMRDKDVLYVSNAPAAELQKFLNIAVSIAYPLLNVFSVTK